MGWYLVFLPKDRMLADGDGVNKEGVPCWRSRRNEGTEVGEQRACVFRKQGEPRLDRTWRSTREAGIRKRGAALPQQEGVCSEGIVGRIVFCVCFQRGRGAIHLEHSFGELIWLHGEQEGLEFCGLEHKNGSERPLSPEPRKTLHGWR